MTRPWQALGGHLRSLACLVLLAWSIEATALTVNEVAKDLACPCECPLVLEDCNMTCGLEWKNEIGEMIGRGMTKQQIIDDFIARYGEDARITPWQRVNGKIYQYTRSFDDLEWGLLWTGLIIWSLLMFLGIYVAVRKVFFDTAAPRFQAGAPTAAPQEEER